MQPRDEVSDSRGRAGSLETHVGRGIPVRVVHSSPGRVRLHLPLWCGKGERTLENEIKRSPGVLGVQASSVTRNVLIRYDRTRTDEGQLTRSLETMPLRLSHRPAADLSSAIKTQPSRAIVESRGKERRARIAVRGLDRSSRLTGQVLSLMRDRGVKAWAKPLTGHLLVEYDHYEILLHEIIALVAHLELPELPGEDDPTHPLDPGPLWHNLLRSIGCLIGLGIVTYRRLTRPTTAVSTSHHWAGTVAGILHLVHGIPIVRDGLNQTLSKQSTEIALSSLGIVALTIADFPIGLVVMGVESLLVLGEVMARRSSWRRYEESLDGAPAAEAGAVLRLEAGATLPRSAKLIEGTGTASNVSSLPMSLSPGTLVPAGAKLAGGPFVFELQGGASFEPQPRPVAPPQTIFDRYLIPTGFFSTAFVVFTAIRTRSLIRTFEAMLLVNPRTAVVGKELANTAAAARVLRSGLIVTGSRHSRVVQLPQVLLLDGPRLLTNGLEIAEVHVPEGGMDRSQLLGIAAAVNKASGHPWGNPFPPTDAAVTTPGQFNGLWATATIGGARFALGPPEDLDGISEEFVLAHLGSFILELRDDQDPPARLGLVVLRPHIQSSTAELVDACRRHGVRLELISRGATMTTRGIANRAGISALAVVDVVTRIREHQKRGAFVAFVSDHSEAGPGFAASDLAVGIANPRTGEFPARADLLAPDLRAITDLLEAGARREKAVRDGLNLSTFANVVGAGFGMLPGPLGVERASMTVYFAAMAAMGMVCFRLRGGHRSDTAAIHLADPRPERWARRSLDEVFRTFDASELGLSTEDANSRRQSRGGASAGDQLLASIRNQLRSPITGVLSAGAAVTLILGQPLNTALIAMTTALNVAAGVWQESEIGKAAEALKRLSAGSARVLRDGETVVVANADVVPGDILVFGPGDRVAADARVLSSAGLEVNEAALTGESLPVAKSPDDVSEMGRIVLEGSDVVVGSARALVVAVGKHTRLGSTAAALSLNRSDHSPMARRLSRILNIALPLAGGGGLLAGLAGLVYGRPASGQLAVGVTTALSAIPEGLPLLAGVGQAGVANRLAKRNVLVRRIAAVEALGRVDVACTDKTGTMTEGKLALYLVADMRHEAIMPAKLPAELRGILLTAALASPHPQAADAVIHPTDRAILDGARVAGLDAEVRLPRLKEIAFDSARAFHASRVEGRLCVKGAPEKLVPRCAYVRIDGKPVPIDEPLREAVLDRVVRFAERGLRVLMVTEGPEATSPDDPKGLVVLGFVAIRDPLKPSVPEAVKRCQLAGIRVLMLTGDHPATARAIAAEAGLLQPGLDRVCRASDLVELPDAELDVALDGVAAIARAAPLDKLRIIHSLRRRGHIVAMTGDGVNDAPSLRLADVGVAMGRGGTEVARQAADVVLTDDDFASLVEALVEGRGFWRNMRTALGLLLGGNAGELGLVAGASILGYGSPLTTVQILLVNMITDALPALAVVLQRPQKRDLAGLAREGLNALDSGLKRDVLRRGLATMTPSLGSYMFLHATSGPVEAGAVAFASVIATQLAQTLDAGRVQGTLSKSVVNAVALSGGLLFFAIAVPPVAGFLGLTNPTLYGWGVVGGNCVAAVILSRAIRELADDPAKLRELGTHVPPEILARVLAAIAPPSAVA